MKLLQYLRVKQLACVVGAYTFVCCVVCEPSAGKSRECVMKTGMVSKTEHA